MHMYIITRGMKDRVDRWVNDCLSKYFKFKYKRPDQDKSKMVNGAIQLSMRPIQLWEVVFPEESYDDVLDIIQPYGWNNKFKKFAPILRKLMGLKPIKQGVEPKLLFYRDNVEVIGIGTKEDRRDQDGIEQI